MDAVHILGGSHVLGHGERVDVRWQRQLHEDPVEARIGVEFVDQGEDGRFIGVVGEGASRRS